MRVFRWGVFLAAPCITALAVYNCMAELRQENLIRKKPYWSSWQAGWVAH